jgi:secondary thiamine-phosphate synthase enzyme
MQGRYSAFYGAELCESAHVPLSLSSKGENDMINITEQVAEHVKAGSIHNGIIRVFVYGSTAAMTTIEYDPGLKKDFPAMIDRLAPKAINYEHDNTWHDGNGRSHVRASLIWGQPDGTIPG